MAKEGDIVKITNPDHSGIPRSFLNYIGIITAIIHVSHTGKKTYRIRTCFGEKISWHISWNIIEGDFINVQ